MNKNLPDSGQLEAGPGFILANLACFIILVIAAAHILIKAPLPPHFGHVTVETCCHIEFDPLCTTEKSTPQEMSPTTVQTAVRVTQTSNPVANPIGKADNMSPTYAAPKGNDEVAMM